MQHSLTKEADRCDNTRLQQGSPLRQAALLAGMRWNKRSIHYAGSPLSSLNTRRSDVDDEISEKTSVTSGVLQGSVVGHIPFLVFINDMPGVAESTCRLLADNSIIYTTVNDNKDSAILQADLDWLHTWKLEWGMSFNSSKCDSIHITRRSQPVNKAYLFKGVTLENVTYSVSTISWS